jgi:hypothetical protein
MLPGAATRTASLIVAVALVCGVGAQAPDVEELLARAAAYVAAYERELGSLIAEERYSQRSSVGEGLARGRSVETRELLSEFAMLKLPETASEWAGYRNVLRVNGRPVGDAERRFNVEAFRTSFEDTVTLWKQLNDESARYNIGPITRNVNVPTLPLIVLRADRQVYFTHRIDDASDRVDGIKAVVVAYEELDPPTLASDPKGAPIYRRPPVACT